MMVIFYGVQVRKASIENCKNKLIVIASTYYKEISEQLKEWNFIELVDFVPSDALGKKAILLYGNCHMTIIKLFMNRCGDMKLSEKMDFAEYISQYIFWSYG